MNRRMGLAVMLTCLAGSVLRVAGAASFTEPGTVFYGKVVGTASERPFPITSGELEWTVCRADGVELTLSAALFPWKDGEYSYQIRVPHEALALGLEESSFSVPLSRENETHTHMRITVDDVPAQILAPGGPVFNVAQALRAATYRLDLALSVAAVDSDGDGVPDWWEDKHGLDKQDGSDADGDPDGDGIRNRDEYLDGSDPSHDDRSPTLATTALRAYAGAVSGIRLEVVDSDSAASNLVYRLERVPEDGTLVLRKARAAGEGSDLPLFVGSTFTQEDVIRGKLVYEHMSPDAGARDASFSVTLADEDPEHEPVTAVVALNVYQPDDEPVPYLFGSDELPNLGGVSDGEKLAALNYALGRAGYTVWDGSLMLTGGALSVPSSGFSADDYAAHAVLFGVDCAHVLCGGGSVDYLSGGMEDDVIVGGAAGDELAGCGGRDRFLYMGSDGGNDRIADFSLSDGDCLDLSLALKGASVRIEDYLYIGDDGSNTLIGVSTDGTGAPYTNMVLTVAGTAVAEADVYDLVDDGHLLVGAKSLSPRVSLAATDTVCSENGPEAIEIEVRRRGDTSTDVSVALQISGSAENGVDYVRLPSNIVIPAGEESVTFTIEPYVDTRTELTEVVDVAVVAGDAYVVGSSDRLLVNIEDLAPQIAVEALEPVAVVNEGRAGAVLVSRGGVIDRGVLVRLDVSGTAEAGIDYEELPSYLNMLPYETSALIDIVPKVSADLEDGEEFVRITARPDSTYIVASQGAASVSLVYERLSLSDWRDRHFPDADRDLAAFAAADVGNTGIGNLMRYAFSLDPLDPVTSGRAPKCEIRNGRLMITFRRPGSVLDLDYTVDVSDDMVTWHDGAGYVEPVELPELGGDPSIGAVQSVRRTADTDVQYMRLRVIYVP